jgi:hypothetical protein
MKFEFSRFVFEKYSNHKFHENPSCSMRTDIQTDGYTDRRMVKQTVMMKPIVEFRNFSISPKINTVHFS